MTKPTKSSAAKKVHIPKNPKTSKFPAKTSPKPVQTRSRLPAAVATAISQPESSPDSMGKKSVLTKEMMKGRKTVRNIINEMKERFPVTAPKSKPNERKRQQELQDEMIAKVIDQSAEGNVLVDDEPEDPPIPKPIPIKAKAVPDPFSVPKSHRPKMTAQRRKPTASELEGYESSEEAEKV